jgi:enoyl-CoA hydratase
MARRMSMTGEVIDAATALRVGLVTEVVAHERLRARLALHAGRPVPGAPGARVRLAEGEDPGQGTSGWS